MFMKLSSLYRQILLEKQGPHQYGYVMLFFDFPQLGEIQGEIYEDDVHEEGLEDTPHVTLMPSLLPGVSLDEIETVLNIFEYSDCYLYNISIFENDEYDVLKFDVRGENLHLTNECLSVFPNENKFPEYHPHVTIGYLNKGAGQKYIDLFNGLEFKLKPIYAVYSQPNREQTKIQIKTKQI